MNVNGLPYHKGERVIDITAERDSLRAKNERLREALADAEFLMRQAGKHSGPMQDSFNRSAEDARAALAASIP